jgi:hypothetical protein
MNQETEGTQIPGAEAATNEAAPKKERKARAPKVDEAGNPIVKEKKERKPAAPTMKDKFIRVNVKAADSGLRAGTGRYQFLEAAEAASKVSDLIGMKFTVGDKEVALTGANITGMFSRGHISLSTDGQTWETVQKTVVTDTTE